MPKVSLSTKSVYPHLLKSDADVVARGKLEGEGNPTSSLKDSAFSQHRLKHLSKEQIEQLNNSAFRVNQSIPLIEQHLEKRVSQLFVQAVLCYQTNYRFQAGHTIHQGLGAETLKYDGNKKIPFQAAHSATIPCLYAFSEDTQQEIVFLYRSGFYDESNATIDVIKSVNDADRAIDEKCTDSLLRYKSVELLNKAGKGELTPEKVAKEFSLHLLEEIDKAIERETNDEVKEVLKIYRDKAELLWSYVDDPNHIDRWLDININDPMEASISSIEEKEGVSQEEIHSLIKDKIEKLPVIIRRGLHETQNEARPPNHFYDLYYYNILKLFNEKQLKTLEEAIDIRFSQLEEKIKKFQRIGKTEDLLSKNADKIDQLAQELFSLTDHLEGQPIDQDKLHDFSNQKKGCLRPNIYNLRYRMIRIDQEVQSVIKSKIEDVYHRISNSAKSNNRLETFFNFALFNAAINPSMQKMFGKLLNVSPFETNQKTRELKVNQNVHKVLDSHATKILNISNQVRELALQPNEEKQQLLKKDIDSLFNLMKSQNKNPFIKNLFYKRLFDNAAKKEEKNLLAELLNTTEDQIDTLINKVSKVSNSEAHVKQNAQLIQEIVDVAINQIGRLQTETAKFRRKLMVELRQSHGMSQDHFKKIYKKNYPTYPMSDGTMSNLENGLKPIDWAIVKQLSEIFGISPTIFYPSHFAEEK